MCFPCVCLSVPCALLLLSVSPPLTCSQSPGLCVSLVSPVSGWFPLFSPPVSLSAPPWLFSPVPRYLLPVCIYSPCFFVSRCVFVNCCFVVCSLFFPLFPVFLAFSAFLLGKVITRASDLCLPYNYSPAYSLFGFVCLLLDCLPVYRTLLVNVYSSESTPVLSR